MLALLPLLMESIDRNNVPKDPLGIGPFTDGGNMAIFKTREAAEAFSKEDPFILEGLVRSFVIKDWLDSMLPE